MLWPLPLPLLPCPILALLPKILVTVPLMSHVPSSHKAASSSQPYLIPDLYNLDLRLCRLHPECPQGVDQWMGGQMNK